MAILTAFVILSKFVGMKMPGLPFPVPKSSSGGTGFPACADRLAGGDARPTKFFIFYGWATGP